MTAVATGEVAPSDRVTDARPAAATTSTTAGASLVAPRLLAAVAAPTGVDAAAIDGLAAGVPGALAAAATADPVVARPAALPGVTTGTIPSTALAAYQRAETVMDAADASCGIDWQLLAAVGRVESDHGRYGGGALDAEGVVQPAVIGVRLDGRGEVARIADTDAGALDEDRRFDRAVGPMQFIPSTWSVVGVDADGDGTRNPQDLDDAALASAVYLCSGTDDLTTEEGRRTAVHRYNHSDAYVALVLGVRDDYLEDGPGAVPAMTVATALASLPSATARPAAAPAAPAGDVGRARDRDGGRGKDRTRAAAAGDQPAAPQKPAAAKPSPGAPATGKPSAGTPSTATGDGSKPTPTPTPSTPPASNPPPQAPPPGDGTGAPIEETPALEPCPTEPGPEGAPEPSTPTVPDGTGCLPPCDPAAPEPAEVTTPPQCLPPGTGTEDPAGSVPQ